MSLEVMITMVGLVVAGLAAIVGIWVERDARKPPRYAYGLSVLILMATFVGMFQTYQDAKQGEKLESDMARILATLDKVAAEHGEDIPELNEMVKTEIAAQNRSNPSVVAKVAQRVSDDGRDPVATLSRALPPSEMQDISRKGRLNVKPPSAAVAAAAAAEGSARPMLRLPFGGARASASAAAPAAPVASGSAAPETSAAPVASASVPIPVLRLPGAAGAASGGAGPKVGGRLPGARPGGGDKPAGGDKPKAGGRPIPMGGK